MDVFVWVGMTVLAVVFAALGPPKYLQYAAFSRRPGNEWAAELGPARTALIGVVETVAALALILPMAFGQLTWLSPAAGLVLAVLMGAATVLHVRRGEGRQAAVTAVLLALASLVTVGIVV